MPNEKKIVQTHTRRSLSEKLDDALSSKPTERYLQSKGLSVAHIRQAPSLSPDKQKIIERKIREMKQAKPTPPKPKPSIPKPPTVKRADPSRLAILVTGGLGDVMTVESYLTDEQRRILKCVYYATRQAKAVRQMFESIPIYRKLEHVVLWEDFSKFFAFYSKTDVTDRMTKHKLKLPHDWHEVDDQSIATVFPLVNNHTLKYNGSSLLTAPVADLGRFGLPEKYVVTCPYTINDKRSPDRDFGPADWDVLIKYVEKHGTKAVVVNQGADPIPEHPGIVNLSNKTTVGEAVEVVKKASGYFGIDSAFSVIAAKLFDPPNLVVKTKNPFLRSHKHIYYAPKKSYGFIREQLEIDG